jgi:hypothetical protein
VRASHPDGGWPTGKLALPRLVASGNKSVISPGGTHGTIATLPATNSSRGVVVFSFLASGHLYIHYLGVDKLLVIFSYVVGTSRDEVCALFVWLISHQPAVLLSQNKQTTSNQPAVFFSQNKSVTSHQPNEHADGRN